MKQFAPINAGICGALGILSQPAGLHHGQIFLANDSLFSQATVQVETDATAYGIGYADPNRNKLMELLNFIAPVRPGPRSQIITQYDETEPFETVDYKKVKREIMGDFPQVKQRTSTKATRKLVNRGLSIVLDNDQLKDKPGWQNIHTAWLIDLLTRASLLEAFALYTASAATANVIWDALSSPDMDVKSTNIQVLAPATGFKANRALIGEEATLLRQLAYEDRNNPGGFAGAGALSDEQIASRMGLDSVRTNAERYNNNGTKDTFLGSKLLLFSAQDKESPEDNSNIVRCVSNTDSGGMYATFVQQFLKKTILTVENYELFNAQHTSGLALLTATGV